MGCTNCGSDNEFNNCNCNGPIMSPKGDTGPIGPVGATGANGIDGINGRDGVDGTNGTDGLFIPTLRVKSKKGFYPGQPSNSISRGLRLSWESVASEFLNLNPEIWLFRYKTQHSHKHVDDNHLLGKLYNYRMRSWVHPAHLNGVGYEGKKYFNGTTVWPIVNEIYPNGIHTVWTGITSKIGSLDIDIDFGEWMVYKDAGDIWQPCSSTMDYSVLGLTKAKIMRRGYRPTKFKFAIAVDNPDYDGQNQPKICGPLSNTVELGIFTNKWQSISDINFTMK